MLAKYACDECRDRKIRCSRDENGCAQCATGERRCVYSRSGVIRRRAKRPKKPSSSPTSSQWPTHSATTVDEFDLEGGEFRSQMEHDITTTQDNLMHFGGPENDASGNLATLGAEYSSFWQGPSLRDMARELGVDGKKLLPFREDQIPWFLETVTRVERKGRPIFRQTPLEIIEWIPCHPERVQEKAHLVTVYGILLTEVCLDGSCDRTTVTKLRWNLRIALDDAKLLLEPSDINIQALTMVALHVQELSTPSLCWMLLSTACRMLQVLGVNSKTVDSETREHRLFMFWTLNALDKHLALIFGKPPTLHRAMSAHISPAPLEKLLDFQPHLPSEGAANRQAFRSTFGAHHILHMHKSSLVLSKIWSYLFDHGSGFDEIRKNLDDWYHQSSSVLEACVLTEQAFLDGLAIESMKLGIKSLEFQYNYLKVLMVRTRPALKDECLRVSQYALHLLEGLVSDSTEVFNGMIWPLLYCPFTPFFILFGEILCSREYSSSQISLAAMDTMVSFLFRMKSRHPQAAKLHKIATTFVVYARAALTKTHIEKSRGSHRSSKIDSQAPSTTAHSLEVPQRQQADSTLSQGNTAPWSLQDENSQSLFELFNDPMLQDLSMDMDFWHPNSQAVHEIGAAQSSQNYGVMSGPSTTYDFFADCTFDWLSWDSNPTDAFG